MCEVFIGIFRLQIWNYCIYVLYTLIVTCLWMIQKVIISPKKSNYLFILWVYETVLYRGLKEYVPLFQGEFSSQISHLPRQGWREVVHIIRIS